MAQGALVGQPHAVRRQYPRVRMDHDRCHPELIRDEARMLPGRTSEALQHEVRDVVPLLEGHLFDGLRHVGHCDAQKPLRYRDCILLHARRLRDLSRQCGKACHYDSGVQRQIPARAEDRRKMRGLNLSDHHVCVRDRQRPSAAIASRARVGAGAVGPHAKAPPIEMQYRAAARGDRVDRHDRHAQLDAGDFRIEGSLPFPCI